MIHDLWVTHRCAQEDLRLDDWPDPEGVYGPTHQAVIKFRDYRRDDPEPLGERIRCLKERTGCSLHVGRDCGATWFDREAEAVFLLAYGDHESGSDDDFYNVVCGLEGRGDLYPTDADYVEMENWRAGRWLRTIRDEAGPQLLRDAAGAPEVVFEMDLGEAIAFMVVYEIRDVDEQELPDGLICLLRLDCPGRNPQQAALIAQAILLHTGEQPSDIYRWNGVQIPFGSFAFECLIQAGAVWR